MKSSFLTHESQISWEMLLNLPCVPSAKLDVEGKKTIESEVQGHHALLSQQMKPLLSKLSQPAVLLTMRAGVADHVLAWYSSKRHGQESLKQLTWQLGRCRRARAALRGQAQRQRTLQWLGGGRREGCHRDSTGSVPHARAGGAPLLGSCPACCRTPSAVGRAPPPPSRPVHASQAQTPQESISIRFSFS